MTCQKQSPWLSHSPHKKRGKGALLDCGLILDYIRLLAKTWLDYLLPPGTLLLAPLSTAAHIALALTWRLTKPGESIHVPLSSSLSGLFPRLHSSGGYSILPKLSHVESVIFLPSLHTGADPICYITMCRAHTGAMTYSRCLIFCSFY